MRRGFVDRPKLSELIRIALSALPEQGGHLGPHTRLSEDGSELLAEVADDGTGVEQFLIDEALEAYHEAGQPRVGLTQGRR